MKMRSLSIYWDLHDQGVGVLLLALYNVTFHCRRKNIFRKCLKISFAHKKLKKPPEKVAYLWQLGVFILCSPDCPTFLFYKFFYTTISCRISACICIFFSKIFAKKNPEVSGWSIIDGPHGKFCKGLSIWIPSVKRLYKGMMKISFDKIVYCFKVL